MVGAGEVGTYVADRLSSQGHDVTIIEVSGERVRRIQSELDVEILRGSGTDPEVLTEARVGKAELLVAVTKRDEVNILCALMARKAGVSKTIVRVESRSLRRAQAVSLFEGVDDHLVIDPDEGWPMPYAASSDSPGCWNSTRWLAARSWYLPPASPVLPR